MKKNFKYQMKLWKDFLTEERKKLSKRKLQTHTMTEYKKIKES